MARELLPPGYDDLLRDLKERIQQAQVRAALAVNRELVLLYWQIGHDISAKMQAEGWGAKVVDRLAADLRRAFPEMKGFSPRNLRYMRSFAESYPDETILQQVVAKLPWAHNVILLDKARDAAEREWYTQQTIQHGWS
jgi:predicted nuclease of restriction endonuclease-like (RecB) superfamily